MPSLLFFFFPAQFYLATSVDAERAFSTGRRQVNFMQHNMSSQTFKARMGVGSWSKTPLWPAFDIVKEMIHKRETGEDASTDKLED